MKARLFAALFLALLAAHLCHCGVLWAEEGLPLAAARQMALGKMLYRDAWFDKPPLVPAVYLLWAARDGVPLRIAGAAYGVLACWLAFLAGRRLFDESAGLWAAGLLGFFLIFDTASAVLPLAADLLMLAPHLAAIWLALSRRPLLSGVMAGIAFLCNAKGVFVLASCAVFLVPMLPWLAAGFALPCAAAAGVLLATGAWPFYLDQVWIWSSRYAGSSHVAHPISNGIVRTWNWLGFHAALLLGAGLDWWRTRSIGWKIAAWSGLSLAAVALGGRFFPRYYFQLLPVLVIVAGAGLSKAPRRWVAVAGLLLLVPAIRFGPRYFLLAAGRSEQWADTAMDRESRRAAALIGRDRQPGDTLFVWGFRPDLYVHTELPAGTRFLDCQALTGVPADRHLTQSAPVVTSATAEARRELARTRPTLIVDGLGLYNPALAMQRYPELADWLGHYREVGRSGNEVVYRLGK